MSNVIQLPVDTTHDLPLPTIYTQSALDSIELAALRSGLRVRWVVLHSDQCEQPPFSPTLTNIVCEASDLVPNGHLMCVPSDPAHQWKAKDMRHVTAIEFSTDDGGAMITYIDDDLAMDNGPALHTAMYVPANEEFSDDLADLQSMAGTVCGRALVRLRDAALERDAAAQIADDLGDDYATDD